jgi:hypothetical protein
MSSNSLAHFGETVAGRLSDAELLFLGQVQDLLRAAADGRVPFVAAMTNLLQDLKTIRRNDWDVNAVVGPGSHSSVRTATLPDTCAGRMQPSFAERELLEDFSGLIEFAVRNGISMLSLLASLAHDLVELSTYGWNLDTAKADCFRPKATGWAKLNRDPVPDANETLE